MKRIILFIAPVILIMLTFRPIHSFTVTGTITDEKGSPLPSVSINVKGTTNGTTSSSDGKYTITVADKNSTLVFSSPRLQTKEVKIKGRAVVDVTLALSTKELEEVVVIGYSSAKKKDMTGSVTYLVGIESREWMCLVH